MMIDYSIQAQTTIGTGLYAALWGEAKKFMRSKISWITAGAIVFITLICALFIYILKDPEQARQLGLLGTKAKMFGGAADWTNFFNLVLVIISYAGTVIIGFVFIWIFGREFGNKTVYDILALPTSRMTIVTAKILTASIWGILLTLLVFVSMLLLGTIMDLPGGSADLIINRFGILMLTGLLTVILSIPFALIASLTRGYLPAVGSMFLMIILSQVFETLGYAPYFPWCVPALISNAAEALTGTPVDPPGFSSYLIVGLTGLVSALVINLWWRYADQH